MSVNPKLDAMFAEHDALMARVMKTMSDCRKASKAYYAEPYTLEDDRREPLREAMRVASEAEERAMRDMSDQMKIFAAYVKDIGNGGPL